jgi:hypothetical protein
LDYCLATMPVLGEQIEEDVLPGMFRNDSFVERHSKPWTLR